MKLIGISDPHVTSRIPRGRLGNPLNDFRNKMLFVFKTASELDNAPIICAGDLFNSPRDILALFKFLSVTMKYPDVPFYTVYGQHDMYMRNKKVLNNLAILARSGVIQLLGSKPIIHNHKDQNGFESIYLYGCNWGDKFPIPKKHKLDPKIKKQILSIHAPITRQALFRGHQYHETTDWINKYGSHYDFIIMGDIHRSSSHYYKTKKGEIGVFANTGPMMRLEVTEYMKTHKPHMVIYDTEQRNFEIKYIPVNPSYDVLNFGIHEEVVTEETLGDLYISTKQIEEINVLTIIEMLLKKSKNKKGIREVLSEIAKEINIETD